MDFKEYSIGEFDTGEQKKFRQEVREWIDKNIGLSLSQPAEDRALDRETELHNAKEFGRKLATRGWLVPEWPKEVGGAGLTADRRYIINQEVAARNIELPGHWGNFQGGVPGPTMIKFGTEEQKKEWLPKIAAGALFALGYTEPNAGTDLASLQMRAVSDGDDYIVNGQKMFSSGVHTADYHWLLVRTNVNVPKHRGISLLIADLKSPGITIKEMHTISGMKTHEIFYDNVRIPKKNRIGPEDGGWGITREALSLERASVGSSPWAPKIVDELIKYAKETIRNGKPLYDDPLVEQSLAQLAIEVNILRLFTHRINWMVDNGMNPAWTGAESKIWEAETGQRVANQGMQILGLSCQLEPGSKWVPLKGRVELGYRETVVRSFGGGSDEMMRSVIATVAMGLPREPQMTMPVKK
jgi:alkylation response protein AidB-like acyl-CoA dehydrogenase